MAKIAWATFWAIFSQTHLVTLLASQHSSATFITTFGAI
jgi:hypothetical protein